MGASYFFPIILKRLRPFRKKLAELGNPQVELHLLGSCISVCKVIHLLRRVPSSSLGCLLSLFDSNLCNCLTRIMCCSISDNAWSQSTLPFRLGGLGLRESNRSSNPAFLGSCNSVHIFMSRLAPIFDATSSFLGEDCAVSHFQSLSISFSNLSF